MLHCENPAVFCDRSNLIHQLCFDCRRLRQPAQRTLNSASGRVLLLLPCFLPAMRALQFFIGGQYSAYWGPFAAGSLLASVPIIAVFMSLQRYIIGGLTAGSVKG